MQPFPAAALSALARSEAEPIMRVDILDLGQVVASTETVDLGPTLVVEGAGVQAVRRADIRRRVDSLTIIDSSGQLNPLRATDLLDVRAGHEVRLWRGLRWVDLTTGIGDEHLVPIFTGPITSSSVGEDTGAVTIDLAAQDRSWLVADNAWRTIFPVDEGTPVNDAIRAIIADRLPSVAASMTFNLAATAKAAPDALAFGEASDTNPWVNGVMRLAESAGMEASFDGMGHPRTVPIPDPVVHAPAFRFLVDEANLRVGPVRRSMERGSIFNGVEVRLSATWALFDVYGASWNTDRADPTHYDPADPSTSKLGPRPFQVDDPLVADDAEATALAVAKLPDVLGVEELIEWQFLPHPGLEEGDVFELEYPASGERVRCVAETLTAPPDVYALASTTARRRRL